MENLHPWTEAALQVHFELLGGAVPLVAVVCVDQGDGVHSLVPAQVQGELSFLEIRSQPVVTRVRGVREHLLLTQCQQVVDCKGAVRQIVLGPPEVISGKYSRIFTCCKM